MEDENKGMGIADIFRIWCHKRHVGKVKKKN